MGADGDGVGRRRWAVAEGFLPEREPEPIPRATDYSSLIASDVPIVVQHTRLDARRPGALLSTVAFPAE
jgi:hypothetical protein